MELSGWAVGVGLASVQEMEPDPLVLQEAPVSDLIQCTRCCEPKPHDDFDSEPKGKNGKKSMCRRCRANVQRERLYGINDHDYQMLIDAQCGTCAICDTPFTDTNTPQVDHDHSCCPGKSSCGRCVRGLLCRRCNKAIGAFEDDVDLLRASVEYLKRKDYD